MNESNKMKTTRVCILGGTFNPPHIGHLNIIRSIGREFSCDLKVLLPSGNPPHKNRDSLASKKDRKAMLELLAAGDPDIIISDIELKRRKTTYTVDTLTGWHAEHPDHELFYIIDSDTLFQLESWKDFSTVSQLTNFICVPRPGDETVSISLKAAEIEQAYDTKIFISEYIGMDISSTKLRLMIKDRDQEAKRFLSAPVFDYIVSRGLYSE